ncbi:hypothetical protein GNF10_01135 [Nostoc sp. UCD121]|uniref:hypothetical protein n=1 Tax=unclassified Nostoc TaxID=2593658 RepID=UPI00162A5FF2|nr:MULTISPECIES: hypothetical protein [unclassified Nostoc]MBC1224095.1 hypothetical protein [Nostoc sp. UCD120]MBC1274619.1 hypothetical protein [Nostoc sp. UCD121]MBC1298592.1 hypothetical protein [Nostoc sp. UCD122]
MFLNNFFKRYEQSSNFLEEDKIALREKQNKALEADVKSVLYYRNLIQTQTNNTFDSTRILGIVATAKGAENYLPYTIPKIIQQISEIGMMTDIVIGLNNGFECQTVIHYLSLLQNIEIIHLYTEEKLANNIPARIFDNLICKGKPYYLNNIEPQQSRHRIFVVHQREGQYAAGKIRVLGEIYGSLLLKSIENGWIPPAILMTFDAESQFLVEQKYSLIECESNGLNLIVSQLQNQLQIDLLGTRNKFAVYQKGIIDGIEVLLPNFTEELPPLQWFIDIAHGRFSGFQHKPGGGTFGRSDAIISLLAVITIKYPGVRAEDTQLTILAKYAGFIGDIFLDVVSTNRTPSVSDMTIEEPPNKAWIKQMYRWIASINGLKTLYGEHNIKMVVDDGFPWFTLTNPIIFFKLVMANQKIKLSTVIKKIRFLIIALLTCQEIQKHSRRNPDILQGSQAKAFW